MDCPRPLWPTAWRKPAGGRSTRCSWRDLSSPLTLVLPHPVCREGLVLNAPLWQGPPADAGQFLGLIGKGVLLLTGAVSPAFARAAAAKEVTFTPLPPPEREDGWPDLVMDHLGRARDKKVRPRPRGQSPTTPLAMSTDSLASRAYQSAPIFWA